MEYTIEEDGRVSSDENLAFADIGLDDEDGARNESVDPNSMILDYESASLNNHHFEHCVESDIGTKDTLVIEIIDRGNKSTTRSEDLSNAELPSRRNSGLQEKNNATSSTEVCSAPPREMSLFRAEFILERRTLLRSPYFARLLQGNCKNAHKLQLNLRDPRTNIEALIAASFFLDSGEGADNERTGLIRFSSCRF